jgi:hypothetical protein
MASSLATTQTHSTGSSTVLTLESAGHYPKQKSPLKEVMRSMMEIKQQMFSEVCGHSLWKVICLLFYFSLYY